MFFFKNLEQNQEFDMELFREVFNHWKWEKNLQILNVYIVFLVAKYIEIWLKIYITDNLVYSQIWQHVLIIPEIKSFINNYLT